MELALLVWAVLALVIANVARSRGRSGLAWFILALLVSPLIALIVLAVLPDLRAVEAQQRAARVQQGQMDDLLRTTRRAQAQAEVNLAAMGAAPPPAEVVRRKDPYAALAALGNLHDKGLVSDEEYAAKKAELLGRV